MRIFVPAILVISVVFPAAGDAADKSDAGITETLTDIQHIISQDGDHTYTVVTHDANANRDSIKIEEEKVTDVHLDRASCRLDFHAHFAADGKVYADGPSWILFNTVESVHIIPVALDYQNGDKQAGHPELTVQSDQPLMRVVVMHRSFTGVVDANLHRFAMVFGNDQKAIRFSNAVMRAAKICGASPNFSLTIGKKQIASQDQISAVRQKIEQQKAASQEEAERQNQAQQAQEDDDARQQKINDLQNDIQEADSDADDYENMAQSAVNNSPCFGGGLGETICRQMAQNDANKYTQQANDARQKADRSRRQLAELQNAPPPPPSQLAQSPQIGSGSTQTMPNLIQNAANQQTAAILAMGGRSASTRTVRPALPAPRVVSQSQSPDNDSTPSNNGGYTANRQVADSNQYTTPLSSSCVGQFWYSKQYGWLSFQNNCGQAIHLQWISQNGAGPFSGSGGSNDISAGGSTNIGQTPAEVNAAGGYSLYVCPRGYVAADGNGRYVTAPHINYRCKKW